MSQPSATRVVHGLMFCQILASELVLEPRNSDSKYMGGSINNTSSLIRKKFTDSLVLRLLTEGSDEQIKQKEQ